MIFALAATLLVSANSSPPDPITDEVVENGPVGVWRIAQTTPKDLLSFPASFYFDGKYLTLELAQSEDGIYRLQTVWRRSDLYYRYPFGSVGKFTFENGRFVERSKNWEIVYEKIDSGRENKEERLLLKKRKPHDYRINVMGELQEQEQDDPLPD
jgi:hypothetical protein